VSQESLGLYDTPADRQEFRLAFVTIGLLLLATVAILPVRDVRWPVIDAFVPIVNAIMFVGGLISATILYAQARVARSRALIVLASGYLLAAFLLVPHTLTFPGAFAPEGLLKAGLNGAAWVATFRRAALTISILIYGYFKRSETVQPRFERPPVRISIGVVSASVLTVLVTILATSGQGWLPAQFLNRSDVIYEGSVVRELVMVSLFGATEIMLLRARKSVLDLWLIVAVADWLIQALLIMLLHSRFTVGWYYLFFLTLFAHLVVMLALVAESNRLYGKLALSTAALNRERESRFISMGTVTAAIAHEVGQPLNAVGLNALAALNCLTQARPDIRTAITALRAISEDRQRTFDVITSVRTTFANGPGSVTVFNLNNLVHETASLLERELRAGEVSLRFALDRTLPSVMGDRVQMQRVLLNLFTNAIESLSETAGGPHRITVRSRTPDISTVLLEITDTGSGIPPDKMERVFDAFFTTKVAGTGLGLAMCRTIVEEHGGRLWASKGNPRGTILHLELPSGERRDIG